MNQRDFLVDGLPLPLLQSPVIPEGFAHGFPTRAGGVSGPPYQTLNFARAWGDGREAVLQNRRRLLAALGVERLYMIRQVHGAQVVQIGAGDPPETLDGAQGDAMITDQPGAGLGVFSADCVPLLFADPETGACGTAHAGWRGVVAGIASATVAAMAAAFGTRPAALRVAMGPAIGPCCFEVGDEVVAAFEARHPGARGLGVVVEGKGARAHIDLPRSLSLELQNAGLPLSQLDASAPCTLCDPAARFYSYRRDNRRTGQHMALIARRPG
jgi:YfiH family protein